MELSYKSLTELILFGLNFGLLLGGIAVQLPQIYKIVKNRSVAGLSEVSWVIQVFSTGAYVAFNYVLGYPFMTWGDAFFAVIEYCVIVACCWVYDPAGSNRMFRSGYTVIFLVLTLMTVTKAMPSWLLMSMGVAPMPMVVIARVPQILLNHNQKHTGQLAFESLAMQVAGNTARIISTLVMVPDKIVLMSHVVAAICNGIPLAQVLLYWDNTQKFLKEGQSKKSDAAPSSQGTAESSATKASGAHMVTTKVENRRKLDDD
eukprot:Gregarina_sp_Pseudo_9__3398@NODE_356_length_3069_cov_67_338614_g335_i0_p2_GENE_NODE_356_length_3069_cov_67_338614_g335_i0NODE_356_length_3069_cov_67_338614_g335_i0_p2_ORF_typecomplete_len260_score22_46PQloop/PF04193_14/2_4e09PQloop/PF04193_14/4_7e09MtN3_slv/PF03083_16/0_00058MtN3_slv/PF03083_16/32HlyIII/PF03006_20/0_15_NODE_356_length_3069_cov_67_338614_g335_i0100879